MKLYECARCGNLLYFESVSCTRCDATLGFLPDRRQLVALEPADEQLWRPVGSDAEYHMCANYREHECCNWMVEGGQEDQLCVACSLNRTIPDLSVDGNRKLWRALEVEKRRLVYSLLRFGLPTDPGDAGAPGLAFDFLADAPPGFSERDPVLTGHADGLITLNIAEADPVERERMRDQMDEPYRTILGHFRHESGHYYWDRLFRDSPDIEQFRSCFGDERQDYAQSLQRHYEQGPAANWHVNFVSAYASSHPWEDWAETWAHYLHMVDTLETAYNFGLRTRPRAGSDDSLDVDPVFDSYAQSDFGPLIDRWLPLTIALNSLNRSMGHAHVYPFILTPAVIEKLAFVHRSVHAASSLGMPNA